MHHCRIYLGRGEKHGAGGSFSAYSRYAGRSGGNPKPSTLDDLRSDSAMKDSVAFLVEVKEPGKTVRVNITARESQIAEIDRLAAAAGLNRSAYMIRCALGKRRQA
jgi:HicB_like antitoxin of bacterial toxin-antitoxin system